MSFSSFYENMLHLFHKFTAAQVAGVWSRLWRIGHHPLYFSLVVVILDLVVNNSKDSITSPLEAAPHPKPGESIPPLSGWKSWSQIWSCWFSSLPLHTQLSTAPVQAEDCGTMKPTASHHSHCSVRAITLLKSTVYHCNLCHLIAQNNQWSVHWSQNHIIPIKVYWAMRTLAWCASSHFHFERCCLYSFLSV